MNWPTLRLVGTPSFRAFASRFVPAADAAGFRPVVAGQYLRQPSGVAAPEFVFLEPAARIGAVANWSVTISPRWIWQHLSGAVVERAKASTTTNTSDNRRTTSTSERTHTAITREAESLDPRDRLSRLREFASWVSTLRNTDERQRDASHTNQTATTITSGRQAFATHEERNVRSCEFQPVTLTFRQFAHAMSVTESSSIVAVDRSTISQREIAVPVAPEPATAGPPEAGWHTRLGNHAASDYTRSTFLNSTLAVRSGPPLVLTQQSRQVVSRFATHEPSAPATAVSEVRHAAGPPIGFGTMATLAMNQPVPMVPVVCQVANREARAAGEASTTTVVIPGAGSATAFASALTQRFGRTAQVASDASAPSGVTTVVRLAPRPASPAPVVAPGSTVVQSASPPVAAPPGLLSPALMQQLTEQVVRALDARAVAERERRGGF